jgi:hypothetical protein
MGPHYTAGQHGGNSALAGGESNVSTTSRKAAPP